MYHGIEIQDEYALAGPVSKLAAVSSDAMASPARSTWITFKPSKCSSSAVSCWANHAFRTLLDDPSGPVWPVIETSVKAAHGARLSTVKETLYSCTASLRDLCQNHFHLPIEADRERFVLRSDSAMDRTDRTLKRLFHPLIECLSPHTDVQLVLVGRD